MGLNNSASILYSQARRARVIIADPYPVILQGFRKMIEDDGRFQVVGEVSTMPAFWKTVTIEQPEVVLLDWSMASQDAEMCAELLQSELHPTSIIFITGSDSLDEERDTSILGAQTVVSKWCSAETLLASISKVCKQPVPDTSSAAPIQDPAERISQLTKRERQLLPLVCSGMKNKEIATRLGIAESTVWHHLTSVFTKLDVEDRLGLATFAFRHQLVPAHDGPLQFRAARPM